MEDVIIGTSGLFMVLIGIRILAFVILTVFDEK